MFILFKTSNAYLCKYTRMFNASQKFQDRRYKEQLRMDPLWLTLVIQTNYILNICNPGLSVLSSFILFTKPSCNLKYYRLLIYHIVYTQRKPFKTQWRAFTGRESSLYVYAFPLITVIYNIREGSHLFVPVKYMDSRVL